MATKKTLTFGDHMSRGVDLVRLGRLAEAGATVEVNFDASGEFVLGIIGKRGSGKSYSLGSILESLCTAEGETTIGRCSRNQVRYFHLWQDSCPGCKTDHRSKS